MNTGEHEVLYSMTLPSCSIRASVPPASPPPAGHQPRFPEGVGADQPVVGVRDVEERRRHANLIEHQPLVASSASSQMPMLTAAIQNRLLLGTGRSASAGRVVGEFTISKRVSGVSAASRRSMSSCQPDSPKTAAIRIRHWPREFSEISTRLGHSGVTQTTRSPRLTMHWAASDKALTRHW